MSSQLYSLLFGLLALVVVSTSENIPEECKSFAEDGKELCCQFPEMESSEDNDNFKECIEMVTNKKYSDLKDKDFKEFDLTTEECIDECVFNKTGCLTPAKGLIADKVKEELLRAFKDSDVWKLILGSAITNCLELAPKAVKGNAKCSSGSHQLMQCTMKELYLNCPKEKWTTSDSCKDEKALLEKCIDYVF